MDISVIVPVFNTPRQDLTRCFQSICFSDDICYEVIIVDDGSNKATAEYCSKYAEVNNKFVYYRQENKGVSAARNYGIELATGKFIMFLDSDDELIGSVLKKSEMDFDYDFLCYDHVINENGKTRNWKIIDTDAKFVDDKSELLKAAYQNRMNSACTKLYSRKLILERNLRFNESMVIAEDAVFVLHVLFAAKKLCYIPKAAYCYYHCFEHGNNRLIKFSKQAIHDLYNLYAQRVKGLETRMDCALLTSEQYNEMRLNADVHFVEEIFNSLAEIWTKTKVCVEDSEIDKAIKLIWAEHRAQLPLKTRIKCGLLRYDIKCAVLFINFIRELILK